jgi:hypothetical protein
MVAGRKRKIELLHRMGQKAPGGRAKQGITSREAYSGRVLAELARRIEEETAREG